MGTQRKMADGFESAENARRRKARAGSSRRCGPCPRCQRRIGRTPPEGGLLPEWARREGLSWPSLVGGAALLIGFLYYVYQCGMASVHGIGFLQIVPSGSGALHYVGLYIAGAAALLPPNVLARRMVMRSKRKPHVVGIVLASFFLASFLSTLVFLSASGFGLAEFVHVLCLGGPLLWVLFFLFLLCSWMLFFGMGVVTAPFENGSVKKQGAPREGGGSRCEGGASAREAMAYCVAFLVALPLFFSLGRWVEETSLDSGDAQIVKRDGGRAAEYVVLLETADRYCLAEVVSEGGGDPKADGASQGNGTLTVNADCRKWVSIEGVEVENRTYEDVCFVGEP